MKNLTLLFILVLFCMFLPACNLFEEEEEDGPISVSFEVRTSSCNNYSYGEWVEECVTYDYPREDWTLKDFEDNFSGSGTECSSTCCINFEYKNTHAFYGTCP